MLTVEDETQEPPLLGNSNRIIQTKTHTYVSKVSGQGELEQPH